MQLLTSASNFVPHTNFVWVAMHVDDSVIIPDNVKAKEDFEAAMANKFKSDDRGPIQYGLLSS